MTGDRSEALSFSSVLILCLGAQENSLPSLDQALKLNIRLLQMQQERLYGFKPYWKN
jgi:hypothetical protein